MTERLEQAITEAFVVIINAGMLITGHVYSKNITLIKRASYCDCVSTRLISQRRHRSTLTKGRKKDRRKKERI